jgi:hypothetical protein
MEEDRYVRYALSVARYLELDTLTGQMGVIGLDTSVPFTRDETLEVARFCIENRNIIEEACGKMGELALDALL